VVTALSPAPLLQRPLYFRERQPVTHLRSIGCFSLAWSCARQSERP